MVKTWYNDLVPGKTLPACSSSTISTSILDKLQGNSFSTYFRNYYWYEELFLFLTQCKDVYRELKGKLSKFHFFILRKQNCLVFCPLDIKNKQSNRWSPHCQQKGVERETLEKKKISLKHCMYHNIISLEVV